MGTYDGNNGRNRVKQNMQNIWTMALKETVSDVLKLPSTIIIQFHRHKDIIEPLHSL